MCCFQSHSWVHGRSLIRTPLFLFTLSFLRRCDAHTPKHTKHESNPQRRSAEREAVHGQGGSQRLPSGPIVRPEEEADEVAPGGADGVARFPEKLPESPRNNF